MNAEASWQGGTITGGCDEGCNAYIFAELLDAKTGAAIDGYTRNESEPLMNVTGTANINGHLLGEFPLKMQR